MEVHDESEVNKSEALEVRMYQVRVRPDTDSDYHKPYACILWSGCKVNKDDDKQHCI